MGRVAPTTALVAAFLASIQIVNALTKSGDAEPDEQTMQQLLDSVDPIVLSTTPRSGPKAGKAFVVRVVKLNVAPGERPGSGARHHPDRYSCLATLGERLMPGSGAGGCTFRIGKRHTRGKELTIVVTASYRGATTTWPFRFVVSGAPAAASTAG